MSRFVRLSAIAAIILGVILITQIRAGRAASQGTLALKCDIRAITAADDVACAVSINGVPQGTISAGTTARYPLDAGSYTASVTLTGAHAALWSPDAMTKSSTIYAGYTRSISATFYKKGLLTLTVNQPNVLADYYLDGLLIASQVASVQVYAVPLKYHKVEARNISDPAANGVYRWKDTSLNTYVYPASVKTVQLALQKQYLKGFLNLTCKIPNAPANETLFCQPTIDGVEAAPIPLNGSVKYPLDPGSHTYSVMATPQGDWIQPYPVFYAATITAGATRSQTVTPYLYICKFDWFFEPHPDLCALDAPATSPAAYETFEHGMMLWLKSSGARLPNYQVMADTPYALGYLLLQYRDPLTIQRDTSSEVGPPPAGLFAPISGFGAIWRGDVPNASQVRGWLGWATLPEQAYDATYQCGNYNPYRPQYTCYVTLPDGRLVAITYTGLSGWYWGHQE